MKKTILISLSILLFFSSNSQLKAVSSEKVELTKEVYYDKTLACILGQVGGFLSGFEFVNKDGKPYVGLPDEWFSICKGPYGGGPKHGSAGESCVVADGFILQDDDYHVDFFNQLIFDQSANIPTSLDIQRLWKKHQVRDWGGGAKAMEIINKQDLVPPFTGMLEYGNIFSWCTEPYIENETVGCVAPGMPQTADVLTNRFALTTGEYESVIWARFFGVMYSIAYLETNAVDAMKKASTVLPEWSYAKFMYDKALELHQKHSDWRAAAQELAQYGRYIYRIDNVHVAYDINGAFTVLSILYGDNNYYESIKIASLMGYDGDCTAATVGGLLGIIKGMDGTDLTVKKVIYNEGEGVLVNDGTFVPYIRKDYPEQQKFTDIALLYQKNAERVILANGGEIIDNRYIISAEVVKNGCEVNIPNRDFENDEIDVKKDLVGGAQATIDKIQTFSPHSGARAARILTNRVGAEGKIYLQTNNLEIGKVYKLTGYLVAKGENKASLFIQNGSQFLTSSTYNNPDDWYCRSIVFRATNTSADIGLYVPAAQKSNLFNAFLDDITIDECRYELLNSYEAETLMDESTLCLAISSNTANASNNMYVDTEKGAKIKGIRVTAQKAGEHLMRIRFSNISGGVATARIMKNGNAQAKFPMYRTGETTFFEENIVEIPVDLDMGENVLSIEQFSESVSIDKIEIVEDKSLYSGQVLDYPVLSINEDVLNMEGEIRVSLSETKEITVCQQGNTYSMASLYSIVGGLIENFSLSEGQTTHPMSYLPNGIYMLFCSGAKRTQAVKFVCQ